MLDPVRIRAEFPSLAVSDGGRSRVHFDNPGGTQVPRRVVDRVVDYLGRDNANTGGPFVTSRATDELLDHARIAMADLYGGSAGEIVFGQNMTTLTFAMSRALSLRFGTGDRLLLTRMDHDANVAPWLLVARDLGLEVDFLPFSRETWRYELDHLETLVTDRTVLAALNLASNALGTINDLTPVIRAVHAVGGIAYVDAVQHVPHAVTDVATLGCDVLVASAYKFFGPHQGILWARRDLLESLEPYKVRPAEDASPYRFETGTLSHEGIAGILGAVEYLEGVAGGGARDRRSRIMASMRAIAEYERTLCTRLLDGLETVPGITVYGITDRSSLHERVPTVVFRVGDLHPADVNRRLAAENIFAWDGNYYALEVTRWLGVEERGGFNRVGLAHYNTAEEVDRFVRALSAIAG